MTVPQFAARPKIMLAFLLALVGCGGPSAEPELIYGRRGVQGGEFVKPRAVAIDSRVPGKDRVYIVDFTARVQVFDRDGKYLDRRWTTPDYRNGRPSGLSIDRDGNLLLSDSHYHCLRIYSPDGEELRKISGESGTKPGQFSYISHAVQDSDGFYYVAEFGETQRISKLDAMGKFVSCWGTGGQEPGQFSRIRALALGPKDGNLYVADACNHRIQVFTRDGKFVSSWGVPGKAPGQLDYPMTWLSTRQASCTLLSTVISACRSLRQRGISRLLGWSRPGTRPPRQPVGSRSG